MSHLHCHIALDCPIGIMTKLHNLHCITCIATLPWISVWRNPKSERNRIRNFFPIPNIFDTESDTFFDTNFFPIPIPILFFDTKILRNRYQYFFRYQIFSKPIPILFSKPKNFETETDTFFDTKIFWNRYRYHRNNWKSFETEKFRKPKCHTLILSHSGFMTWLYLFDFLQCVLSNVSSNCLPMRM